jgi:hypothetical protein
MALKRVNIHLKEETHTLAKLISTLEKITLNEYFEKAILQAIEKDKEKVRNLVDKKSQNEKQ